MYKSICVCVPRHRNSDAHAALDSSALLEVRRDLLLANGLHFIYCLFSRVGRHPAVGFAAYLITGRLCASAVDSHGLLGHDCRVGIIVICHGFSFIFLRCWCTWVEAEGILLLLRREVRAASVHKYICLMHL